MLATISIGHPSRISSSSPAISRRPFRVGSAAKNRCLACFIALFLACTVTAFASRPALAPLAETESEPANPGWWDTVSARKWEFSFMPGETRYGFRIPVYPALACIVLILSCSSLLDNAQRQKKSGVGPGVAMGAGVFLFLSLLWQAAFHEPKLHLPSSWNAAEPPRPRVLSPTLPPSESLLRNPELVHPGSRASDLLKSVAPSNPPPPAKPTSPEKQP